MLRVVCEATLPSSHEVAGCADREVSCQLWAGQRWVPCTLAIPRGLHLVPTDPQPLRPMQVPPVKLLEILQSPLSQQAWKLQYHEVRMSRYCWPKRARLQPGKGGAVRQGQSQGRGEAGHCLPAPKQSSSSCPRPSLQSGSSLLFPGPSSRRPENEQDGAPPVWRKSMALLWIQLQQRFHLLNIDALSQGCRSVRNPELPIRSLPSSRETNSRGRSSFCLLALNSKMV